MMMMEWQTHEELKIMFQDSGLSQIMKTYNNNSNNNNTRINED